MSNVKGFAPWKPQKKTQQRLDEVLEVMNAARKHWPLSQRYWLYRLMGKKGWEKFDEYNAARYRKEHNGDNPPREPYNLNHILDRGRRARLISWEAVVATRGTVDDPLSVMSANELADRIEYWVEMSQLDRQAGQDRYVVLWMEAEGLIESVVSVGHEYGATVLSGKGFDVIGKKYDFAQQIAEKEDVLILHCGDLDGSGDTMHRALDADLQAFIEELGGRVEVRRILLLEKHIPEYGLGVATVPVKASKSNHGQHFTSDVECQLEAMDITDIKAEIRAAFEQTLDMDKVQSQIEAEKEMKREALEEIAERVGL